MVTILLTSIGKRTMNEAILSALAQTDQDFQLVVMDNGTGPHSQENYERYYQDPRVDWHWIQDVPGVCPVTWVFNQAYASGLIRGEFFCCHYDDDIYYPNFVEKMGGYLRANPEIKAVRCTQTRRALSFRDQSPPSELRADRIMYPHDDFDCVVDGMQVMFRSEILPAMAVRYNGEIMPEALDTCSHSDGVFYNRAREYIPEMHFIEEALCEHRHTPWSTFTPTQGE